MVSQINCLFIRNCTYSFTHVEVRIHVENVSPPEFPAVLIIVRVQVEYRMVVVPGRRNHNQANYEEIGRSQPEIPIHNYSQKLKNLAAEVLDEFHLSHSVLRDRTEVEERDQASTVIETEVNVLSRIFAPMEMN